MVERRQAKKRGSAARRFHATRSSHRVEAAEDYTELIADLIVADGEARICRVAEKLGISHVTALRTVKRLAEEGYLKTQPYGPILLTQKGAELAAMSKERHKIVLDLLRVIGVPSELAEIDSEGIEHHISPATLKIIQKFLKNHH
jgi:DtxR family manganese transport transcriptional regulator